MTLRPTNKRAPEPIHYPYVVKGRSIRAIKDLAETAEEIGGRGAPLLCFSLVGGLLVQEGGAFLHHVGDALHRLYVLNWVAV